MLCNLVRNYNQYDTYQTLEDTGSCSDCKTVGMYKVDVAAQRIAEINPDAQVRTYKTFFMPDTAEQFDFSQYDYIVDAIDTVARKLSAPTPCLHTWFPLWSFWCKASVTVHSRFSA